MTPKDTTAVVSFFLKSVPDVSSMVSKAYPTSWWGQKSILPQYDTTAVVSYWSIFNTDSVRKAPRGLLRISYKVKKSTALLWHNRGCVTSTQSAKLFQQKDAQLSAQHFSQSRIIIWPTVTQPRLCHKYPTGKVSSSKLIRRAPRLQIKVTVLQKCIAVTQPRLCHFESDGHIFSPEWSTEPVETISQPRIFIIPCGGTTAVVSQLSKINNWGVKSLP